MKLDYHIQDSKSAPDPDISRFSLAAAFESGNCLPAFSVRSSALDHLNLFKTSINGEPFRFGFVR